MAVKAQCDEERDCFAAAGAGKHICAAGGTDGEQAFHHVNASTCTWLDGTSCSRRPRPGEAWWPQWCTRCSASLGSSGMKALGMVEDADLKVAEAASCGGKCWRVCGR